MKLRQLVNVLSSHDTVAWLVLGMVTCAVSDPVRTVTEAEMARALVDVLAFVLADHTYRC